MSTRFIRLLCVIALGAAVLSPAFPVLAASTGELVRSASLPAVYFVTADGRRIVFPNETTYFSWYQDFNQVKIVSDEELAALSIGGVATLRPGLFVVKTAIDPKVYAVSHGGTLRWLTNETVAKMIFGNEWTQKIVIIPEEFLTAYKYGSDIVAGGQYWWQKELNASPTITDDIDQTLSPDAVAPVIPEVAEPETSPASAVEESVPESPTETVVAKNVLYILWDPKRPEHPFPDKTVLERVLFGREPSLADYFSKESNNHIKVVNAGILGWYQAEKSYESYWLDDTVIYKTGFKTGAAEATAEALDKADTDFDFNKYDANQDKKLTPDELGIFIVIPQLGNPDEETVTPYAADDPAIIPFIADGVTINSVEKIYVGTPLGDVKEFGTLLHSFAKYVLGLSDISTSTDDRHSVGSFSLMSAPLTDLRLDPYNRIKLGWITPTVIPKALEVSTQMVTSSVPDRTVIRVDRDQPLGPSLGTEYLLIENRQRGVYDNSLPDEGIVIWDISGNSIKLLRLYETTPVDDTQALWRTHYGSYAPTALELYWASDGVRSGVNLVGIGFSSAVMNFTLNKKILDEMGVRSSPSAIN